MRFWAPILTMILLTVAAYGPNLASLWTYDDYSQVYGIFDNPFKSFTEGLSRSDQGVITPHRLLMYWFIGIGGAWGPAKAHMLALILHVVCACLFGALVWRMFRSPTLVFLASTWFILAPWVSQPVLWWSAVSTIVSTICLLMAAHFFLNGLLVATAARRLWWIVMAWLAAFLGLCFYDLWFAGFLLFVGIGFVLCLDTDDALQRARWRGRSGYVAAMSIPFVLWGGLVAIIGRSGHPYSGVPFSLERLPIVLASIHLRVANWFIGPDWLALWKMGIDAMAQPLLAFAFIIGSGSLVLVFARFDVPNLSRHRIAATIPISDPISDPPLAANQKRQILSAGRFPWSALFLAWMMFLASRLVLILQGAVSLQSRLNYGAGMAVALAAAALARWAWHRWCKRSSLLRWSAVIGAVASILLMTLATAGRARHMALVSQAEDYAIGFLDQVSRKHPECSITIMGTPVPDIGDLRYWHGEPMRRMRSTDVRGVSSDCEVFLRWSGHWPKAKLEAAVP